MSRKTDLKEVLFPVELHPIYTDIPATEKLGGKKKQKVLIQTSQAVINTATGYVLGVVSRDYKLITNKEAIQLGQKCCQELFGLGNAEALEIFNVYAPTTFSYCHIDLVHKGFKMNLFDNPTKPDIYLPFVRITNSYNTCRSLRFDIGFCRKICLNGTIFETETVKFVYSHLKHKIGKPIQFDIKKDKLEKLIIDYKDAMQALKDFAVEKGNGKHIFSIVLGMPDESEAVRRETDKQEFDSLTRYVDSLFEKYYKEMGDNAYSLFNIITDMASNPPENKFFRKDINAMQRVSGTWLSDFRRRIHNNKDEFQWGKYIEELKQQYENRGTQYPNN